MTLSVVVVQRIAAVSHSLTAGANQAVTYFPATLQDTFRIQRALSALSAPR